jgi:hypothetical protein
VLQWAKGMGHVSRGMELLPRVGMVRGFSGRNRWLWQGPSHSSLAPEAIFVRAREDSLYPTSPTFRSCVQV